MRESAPGSYTVRQIKALLGLGEEDQAPAGHRQCTILDIRSWAQDPGGGHWLNQDDMAHPDDQWMARRGPLRPDSEEAAVLLDFERAMRKLRGKGAEELRSAAMVALTAAKFDFGEIAAVLGVNRRTVERRILGRERVGATGRSLRRRCPGDVPHDHGHDVCGPLVREPTGSVHQVTDLMNGGDA